MQAPHPKPASRPAPRAKAAIAARIAIAVATLATAGVVFANQMAFAFAGRAPELALRFDSSNSIALGNAAVSRLTAGLAAGTAPRIRAQSLAALDRAPANAAAVQTLALIALTHENERAGLRLLASASAMSRRQPQVQIALIEQAVQRGDVAAALRHYDTALRTSRGSAGSLIPVLVSASSDRLVARPLMDLLARRPEWRLGFARGLIFAPDLSAAFTPLLDALALDPAIATERDLVSAAIARLLDAGRNQAAYARYRAVIPGAPARPLPVRGGTFAPGPGLAPLDWTLETANDVNASIGAVSDGQALWVSANRRSSVAARQALLLEPGSYRLSATVNRGAGAGNGPTVNIVCRGRDASLVALAPPPRAGMHRLVDTFTVPLANCPNQVIEIIADPLDSGESSWIGSVAISTR